MRPPGPARAEARCAGQDVVTMAVLGAASGRDRGAADAADVSATCVRARLGQRDCRAGACRCATTQWRLRVRHAVRGCLPDNRRLIGSTICPS